MASQTRLEMVARLVILWQIGKLAKIPISKIVAGVSHCGTQFPESKKKDNEISRLSNLTCQILRNGRTERCYVMKGQTG